MIAKRFLLLLSLCFTLPVFTHAQGNDFCTAINLIVRDAPNQFRNIKGRMTESNMNATIWASGINVPGAIKTRFVAALGLFYECAFYQTKNKEDLKVAYEKYKSLLSGCLHPQGYALSQHENFYTGMGEFKKLVYMLEPKDDAIADTATTHVPTLPPSHVTMEADYSKETGSYTIVMYIFEH